MLEMYYIIEVLTEVWAPCELHSSELHGSNQNVVWFLCSHIWFMYYKRSFCHDKEKVL